MLDAFKQQKSFLTRTKETRAIIYRLRMDDGGAYVEPCDTKFTPLDDPDYRLYNGLDRQILELLQRSAEAEFFTVSWGASHERSYLHEQPRLMELLRCSDRLYGPTEKRLQLAPESHAVELVVREQEQERLQIRPLLDGEPFILLTPDYALCEETITQVAAVGERFAQINALDTTIEAHQLEAFLSIFYTHFENVDLRYGDYAVHVRATPRKINPALVFERVSDEDALVMHLSATIGAIGPDFFIDFNVTRIALQNRLERTITVSECDFGEVFGLYAEISKILGSLKRKHKGSLFDESEGRFVIDAPIARAFIGEHLKHLIGRCALYGSEKLKAYRYTATFPTLQVAFGEKIDYLDRKAVHVDVAGERFDLFELIALHKKHAYVPLSNGDNALIDPEYIKRLERIFKKLGKEQVKVSFFDLPEIEMLIEEKTQKVFEDSRAFYEGFNTLAASRIRLPKLPGVTLRDYQKYGARWLRYLYDHGKGGCLADDMGLGKTLQAIMLLSFIYPKAARPSLIVMPRSLLANWQNELRKFNPALSFYCFYGPQRSLEEAQQHQLILTTYALVRNDIEQLKVITFDTIILDESQAVKNLDSQITKAVMLLEGEHRFALSGTPVENSLLELYALFRFLNAGMFATAADFKRDYAQPIQTESNEVVARALKAKVSPFLLRRLKRDVLKDLPPKQEQVVYVEMEEAHRRFYVEKREYYKQILEEQVTQHGIKKLQFVILQALNDLRQIASAPELKSDHRIASSKTAHLFEMLDDIIAGGHKVLIFANFLGSLDLVAAEAEARGYGYLMMTGATADRQSLVDRFARDEMVKLFLMTLKVGGVGLNLTQADYVFIFDPWWNKAAEDQAIDRAHRIGQKNRVFSYKMIVKESIEEKMLQLQTQKQDLADMIISGDESGLKRLSSDDLAFILG